MGQYQIQRWVSSPLKATAQTQSIASDESSPVSSPSSVRISRLNNLDPVPEDSSLGRKRSVRTHQAQLETERLRASKRRSDANTSRSFSFEEDARSRISGFAPPPLVPSSRAAGKLPTRYLVGSSSPSTSSGQTTSGGRPIRALSDAQETLERERRRVEMIGKRPDWVIDLDALEDGMKVWTKPRASRVILILGEPSTRALRPVLSSTDFNNTLIIFASTSTSSNSPRSSIRPDPKLLSPPPSSPHYGRRLSLPSSPASPSKRSPLSRTATESSNSEQGTSRGTIKELIVELGSECVPEIHMLAVPREGGTVGDIVKQAAEIATTWRKKRKVPGIADLVNDDESIPGMMSRRGSFASEAGSRGSGSDSPAHSRRVSSEYRHADVKDKRATLSRTFPSVLSLASLSSLTGKEEAEGSSTEGIQAPASKTKTRAFDAVVNFLPEDEKSESFQSALQNLLVTTTAMLPHMPSELRITSQETAEAKRRRSSVYSLGSTARTSSFSSHIALTTPSIDPLQTFIHVLPARSPPALIKAAQSYLKSLFPKPDWDSRVTDTFPRAYILGGKVLGQPMKRATNMLPISGLAMILSGAVTCQEPSEHMHLDDFKSCRFDTGSSELMTSDLPDTRPFDTYSIAYGAVEPDLRSDSPVGPTLQAPERRESETDTSADSPPTPPLDYDAETSASSVGNSTHAPSIETSALAVSIVPSKSSQISQITQGPTLRRKGSGWLGKLFSKKRNET